MPSEPTYSQIHMAILAMYPALKEEQITQTDRDNMKRALMAAHEVDPNVYGDMHFGWCCDGVWYMCNSVEAQRRLSMWHHAATSTLPYHEKHSIPELRALREKVKDQEAQLQENEGVMQGMDRVLKTEIRARTDALYMLQAVVQMLGPIGRRVWKMWQDRGVVRQHTSWNPEFLAKATGEEVAQAHLDIEAAPKTLIKDVDAHIAGIDVV